MTAQGILQIVVYTIVLVALAYPLGLYMARVYADDSFAARGRLRFLSVPERGFYRLLGVDPDRDQDWKGYAKAVLIFSAVFSVVLYALLRLQGQLFLNPDDLPGVPSHISLNTAASFVTNTNWQYYGGEYTMSYLSQMAGLAVQNFVSAAVGMAVLVAVIRGFIAALDLGHRELLAGHVPLARLHPVAALDRARRDPHLAGRRADIRRPCDGDDARGCAADDRARPGRVADRDQAARDERRRLLQLELRRPVREPERDHQLPLRARDPPHPRGAGVHVREDGRRDPAGPLPVRCDARHVRRSAWRSCCRSSSTDRRCSGAPASTSPHRAARAAGTCPTRRSASGSPTPPSGQRRRPTLRTAPSTAATTPSPQAAAPCRS